MIFKNSSSFGVVNVKGTSVGPQNSTLILYLTSSIEKRGKFRNGYAIVNKISIYSNS